MAEKLLALASLKFPPSDIVSIIQECAVWPEECVTAFLSAWKKTRQLEGEEHQLHLDALRQARHLLPVEKVSINLQNRLANVEMAILAWEKEHYEYQPIRGWPKPPQFPSLFPEKTAPFVQSIPGKRNPFAHEKAEEDIYYLFGFKEGWASAFWGGHRLFNELFNVDQTTLVFGAQGNGRTTLAYALQYHASQRELLALHLPGRPTPDEIRTELIAHLFNFVLKYPIYLRRLTVAQRQLLACLAISIQSVASLQARIGTRQSAVYSAFSTTPKRERDDIAARLHLLAQDITNADSLAPIADSSWAVDIAALAHSLDLARLLLVLDVGSSDDDLAWLQDSLWPNLLLWERQGLSTILFLPDTKKTKEATIGFRPFYHRQLTWNPEQLERMLTWRYKAFAGPRQALQQHFEEDAFDYLLSQSSLPDGRGVSPRVFIQLWQHIIAQLPPTELITKHVDQVLKKMKGVGEISLSEDVAPKEDIITEAPVTTYSIETSKDGELSNKLEKDLFELISWYLREKERADIATSLGINYASLEGDKVLELILSCKRVGKIQALRDQTYETLRPILKLPVFLAERFNEGELRNLCFALNIKYETLPGQSKADKDRELVEYCERHDRLLDLLEEIKKSRAHAWEAWADV